MPENLDVPTHLRITLKAKNRLRNGWSTDEALIGGLADLENLIRPNPDDHPGISYNGDLEGLPITRGVVDKCQEFALEHASKMPWGALAVVQQGFLIRALEGLEAQNNELARRVAALEQR